MNVNYADSATDGAQPRHRAEAARRLTSARLGVRLARRELWRRPWRTFLVLLLVFLPTAVMAAVVTFVRTTERSSAQQVVAEWGRADAFAHPVGAGDGGPSTEQLDQLRAALPAGSRVLVEHRVQDRVRLGDRRTYVEVNDVRIDDPTARGRFGPVRGRLAKTTGEAVVSTEAARDMGAEIGDTFAPDRLGRSLTVVGIVPLRSGHDHVVFTPRPVPDTGETWVTIDLPGDRDGLDAPSLAGGWTVQPVQPIIGSETDKTAAVFWSYVGGGVGLIVLGTVITAAFAVGARRQLRSVGLLSSTGASPSTVKWFLVAQGAVAGAVGSVVGVAVGVLAVRMVPADVLTVLAGRPIERVTARPVDLVPIVGIGTLAASIAAWLPARSAARVPTLQALAGRRPLPRVPRRLPVLGALSVAAGCALLAMAVAGSRGGGSSLWALTAIVGAVAVLLGAIATAPWVIAGLERASAGLPRSWRLAGRSLARSRVRSSAVVGAVCAVSATLIAGATLFNSLNEPSTASVPYVRDDQVAIEVYSNDPSGLQPSPQPVPAPIMRRIEAIVPGARSIRLTELVPLGRPKEAFPGSLTASYVPQRDEDQVRVDAGRDMRIGAASPEVLDLLSVPSDLRTELERGHAISVTAPPYESRSVQVHPSPPPETPPEGPVRGERVTVPLAGSFDSPSASLVLPTVLISPETAERLGDDLRPGPTTLLILPEPLTDRQRNRLDLLSADLIWEQELSFEQNGPNPDTAFIPSVSLNTPPEPPPVSPALIRAGILAGSLLLVLAVVAVGLALAAKDSEDEHQVLTAVGAPPRTLRRAGALRAVLLVLIAGIISTPAGLLPSAAIVAASDVDGGQPSFQPDLWAVLFVAVLIPALVGLITWTGGRLHDLVRPKRPDVFAFGD